MLAPFFRSSLLLVPLATLLSSCGGSSSAEGPALKDLPAQLAKTVCDVTSQCYGDALPRSYQGTACVDRTTTSIEESDFSLIQGAIDQGKVFG